MLTQSMSKVAAAAWVATVVGFVALLAGQTPSAQQAPAAGAAPAPAQGVRGRGPAPTDTLGAGPWDLPAGRGRIHVTAIKGLDHPWGIAFVTDGSMLVTERPGRLRVIRNGIVDPTPIGPLPQSLAVGLGGALDVTLRSAVCGQPPHLYRLREAGHRWRQRRDHGRLPREVGRWFDADRGEGHLGRRRVSRRSRH